MAADLTLLLNKQVDRDTQFEATGNSDSYHEYAGDLADIALLAYGPSNTTTFATNFRGLPKAAFVDLTAKGFIDADRNSDDTKNLHIWAPSGYEYTFNRDTVTFIKDRYKYLDDDGNEIPIQFVVRQTLPFFETISDTNDSIYQGDPRWTLRRSTHTQHYPITLSQGDKVTISENSITKGVTTLMDFSNHPRQSFLVQVVAGGGSGGKGSVYTGAVLDGRDSVAGGGGGGSGAYLCAYFHPEGGQRIVIQRNNGNVTVSYQNSAGSKGYVTLYDGGNGGNASTGNYTWTGGSGGSGGSCSPSSVKSDHFGSDSCVLTCGSGVTGAWGAGTTGHNKVNGNTCAISNVARIIGRYQKTGADEQSITDSDFYSPTAGKGEQVSTQTVSMLAGGGGGAPSYIGGHGGSHLGDAGMGAGGWGGSGYTGMGSNGDNGTGGPAGIWVHWVYD